MKNRGLIIVGILLTLVVLIILLTPSPTDWRYTYSKEDKIPHGSYILFQELNELFPEAEIIVSDSSSYQTLKDWNKPNSLYIQISPYFQNYSPTQQSDFRALHSFVKKGNKAFIASNYFSIRRIDSTIFSHGELRTSRNYQQFQQVNDTPIRLQLYLADSTEQYVTTTEYANSELYIDTLFHKRLGSSEDTATNFIEVPAGKGSFYFHSSPNMFTNYPLLKDSLTNYAAHSLSYAAGNVDYIIWDEYYKPSLQFLGRDAEQKSALFFINENKALRIAKYITILGALLLIVTKFKRTQRAIPVFEAPENKSLEFVQNISLIHYEKGEHLDIAKKSIQYFEHDFRKRFQLKKIDSYKNNLEELHQLTGYAQEDLKKYFTQKSIVSKLESFTEKQLKSLNQTIEKLTHEHGRTSGTK